MSSKELDGMIYGMILGDGCIRKPTKAGTCNFVLHHSHKQKKYFFHKLKLLEKISHVKTNYWEKNTYNKKANKYYRSIYGQTNFLKYFIKLRKIFYKNNRKLVTDSILNKLTPLGLALWWMDDGCVYVNRKSKCIERRCFWATQNFNYEEHLLIQKYFEDKWNINVTIRQHPSSKQYYLSFRVKEFEKLVEIIKPYIIPSMKHKIDLKKELNKKSGPKKTRRAG